MLWRPFWPFCVVFPLTWLLFAVALGGEPPLGRPPIVYKVHAGNERLEMTVHTSRILTLGQKIPQAQVNNPDVLEVTPLSPTEIQISAKAAGVTQINLWGEDMKVVSTIDVIVYGDAQALVFLLRSQFPNASLKVIPVANGVLISGFVDRPEHIDLIVRIAEEFYPKVINAMTVGGVQQVLLHVKVMEVSRTKLRRLGFDWGLGTATTVITSGISGLLTSTTGGTISNVGTGTFNFNVVDGGSAFFGVLDALRQDNLAKVMADPTLVTVSGRPASFNVGGEFPVPVPQSLGTISIEYKKYGTQLDFVPIVLGSGHIRLEIRPRVSEIDESRSLTIAGTTVPGLRSREVETGVEMQAGQTLAIAGLVYYRTEAMNRGLPWVSEVPYLGAAFRKTSEESNEIELLILVTPELVDALDAHQVPPCGPGSQTTSPSDWELFMQGFPEVPNCCPGGNGAGYAECGDAGGGTNSQAAPPDGMIGPVESIQPPRPGDALRRQARPAGREVAPAAGPRAPNAGPARPQNRYSPSSPNASPAVSRSGPQSAEPDFLGPVGYEVVN
jgi:pilus assembly protein CpaC